MPPPRMTSAGLVALALLAAGCATTPAAEPPPAGACQASRAEFALGRAYAPELGAEMQRAAGAKALRVIRPGEVVTLEWSGERLTVELDAGGFVRKVGCN